ncbi:MAG: peptide chain release factor N(5)-glutamine methyltransferase [Lachnospiraceae bacterium]|nr:peptide chain release factor N(5)-glutamine methyltransferase [Lachnospiraceae bacterium]
MQMEGADILLRAGCPEPQPDARELLFFAAGLDLSSYAANMNETVPEDAADRFFSCIERRKMREPVQYITGRAYFFGYEFLVTPAVLIPRYDTEVSVEEALRCVKASSAVLDLCTGSGCIILSIIKEAQKKFGKEFSVHGYASDISKEALNVAKSNSKRFRIDVDFILSDLFDNIDGFYDIIISNPPYIPSADISGLDPEVADYEPHLALNGKQDGLFFYRKIVDAARRHLTCGGRLIMEIGYDQADSVTSLLCGAGYTDIRCLRDLAGRDRSVSAKWVQME